MDTMMAPYVEAMDEFPVTGTPAARLRAALRWAVLAPSSHNTQPWRFRIERDVLDLVADRTRGLPMSDPEDRELLISCGAALFNLLLALRHFGDAPLAEILPGGDDTVARVTLGASRDARESDHLLFDGIARRHTNRQPFEARPVPAELVRRLEEAARQEGAWLVPVEAAGGRHALADMVAEADQRQMDSRSFRRELAAWMHPSRSRSQDGMPGYALGFSDLMSVAAPLVVRTFDIGGGRAARSRELAEGSPLLAVLGTAEDSPRHWVGAGMALEHAWLRAEVEGVRLSFLNQPLEIADLRARVGTLLGTPGYPQLLLRLGYAAPARGTPRRPVEEMLF